MDTSGAYDYSREAEVLARLLEPAHPPLGSPRGSWSQPSPDEPAYLGYADLHLAGALPVSCLSQDQSLQEQLRRAGREEGTYRAEEDELHVERDPRAAVYLPLAAMDPFEMARYRLRVLLVNSHGVLDGSAHDWAVSVGEQQAFRFWDAPSASHAHWEDGETGFSPQSPALELLFDAEVDLTRWCSACDPGDCSPLPETAPLAWVRESGLAGRLFGLPPREPGTGQLAGEVHLALAYALEGLRSSQPAAGWERLLFLADVLADDAEDLSRLVARLCERVAEVTALAGWAGALRGCAALDQVNAVLQRLYEEAPLLGVWVVS